MNGHQVDGARQQDKGQWHKMEHREFHLNMKKNLYFMSDSDLEEVPREVVESPSMEMLKTHLEIFLFNLL